MGWLAGWLDITKSQTTLPTAEGEAFSPPKKQSRNNRIKIKKNGCPLFSLAIIIPPPKNPDKKVAPNKGPEAHAAGP